MVNTRFSVTKLLLSALAVGLFFTAIFAGFESASTNYDLTEINESSFTQYADYNEITQNYTEFTNNTLDIQADQGAFDVLGNLVSKALSPFKTAIGGIKLGKDAVTSQIQFLGEFMGLDLKIYIQYFLIALGIIIGVGILLFKIYFKSDDNI